MKMNKILYIHHGWGIGGAPLSLLNIIKNLPREKYTPLVLFLYDSEAVDLFKSKGIKTFVIPKFNNYFRHHEKGRLKYYQVLKIFKVFTNWLIVGFFLGPKIYNRIKPDIIHLNSDVLTSWAFAARTIKAKVICHNRDPISDGIFGFRKSIIRKILGRYAFVVISISYHNSKKLNLKNSVVIYNPIDSIFFNDLKVSSNNRAVLYVGGAHKAKGLSLLIRSFDYVDSDIKLYLAGYYPEDNIINRFIYRHFFKFLQENKERVNVLGVISQQEVKQILQKSDLLLFPAIKPHFARPIIEAFATGTPVVCSDIEGMSEIVKQNVNGVLCLPLAEEFGAGINQLINSKTLLEKYGRQGNIFATNYFSEKTSLAEIIKVYSN